MKKIITIVLCFLSISLMSQVDFKKHTVNSNLFSLLNPYYTSVTLGYEFRPIKKFGLELTYGHIFPKQKLYRESNFYMFEGEGSVYRIEPKFFYSTIEERDTVSSFFFSVKLYYADNSYVSKRAIQGADEFSKFNVNQKIKGMIPTWGVSHVICNLMFLETSVGLGRRWITTVNDFERDEGLLEYEWGDGFHRDLERNGEVAKWRININVKLGFSF